MASYLQDNSGNGSGSGYLSPMANVTPAQAPQNQDPQVANDNLGTAIKASNVNVPGNNGTIDANHSLVTSDSPWGRLANPSDTYPNKGGVYDLDNNTMVSAPSTAEKLNPNDPRGQLAPDNIGDSTLSSAISPNYAKYLDSQVSNSNPNFGSGLFPSGAKPVAGPNTALANIRTPLAGGGFIGPDLGGAVKGDMLRQQAQIADNTDTRAESYLGLAGQAQENQNDYVKIAQSKLGIDQQDLAIRQQDTANRQTQFGWQTEDRNRQQMIIKGMTDAAQTGGYGGAIDFLKQVDPGMAIGMEAEKQKLDASILGNQVAQAWAPSQIQNGMLASYATLGKMYQGITNAPQDQQANLYAQALPMIQKVNPNASPQWDNEAHSQGLLATTQAMPENVLWNTAAQQAYYGDEAVKQHVALNMALKNDPSGQGPIVQGIQNEIQANIAKNTQAGIDNTKAYSMINKNNMDTTSKQIANTETFNTNMEKANPEFQALLNNQTVLKPLMDIATTSPNSPKGMVAARGILLRYAQMVTGGVNTPGRLNPLTVTAAMTDNGLGELWKRVQSEGGAGIKTLSAQEVNGIVAAVGAINNTAMGQQLQSEQQFKQSIPGYTFKGSDGSQQPGLIESSIRYPSQKFSDINNTNSSGNDLSNTVDMSALNPNEQRSLHNAMQSKGMTPQQAQQIVNQIKQERGAPAQYTPQQPQSAYPQNPQNPQQVPMGGQVQPGQMPQQTPLGGGGR